ncbi:MAG: energy transducer TonB [Gammaproteobacteria bacterium HGW-Gammaproteobacteria-1]|jgi:protein TonB|nr:MAG: energy transducer TonB [Gammaproteobacteria bacterium HGW-Gammaproteobacteria-1]
MASTLTPQLIPRIGAADRLGLTLFLAVAFHAIVILGISFVPTDKNASDLPRTMEVILVHSKSEEKPDKADYLAQVSQQGGGDVKEKVRPGSPFANTASRNEQGNAPQTQPMTAPPPQAQDPRNVITTDRARLKTQIVPGEKRPEVPETLTAAELMPTTQEMAALAAEISQRMQTYAAEPRHKYITASTREYIAASYENAWRMKVERIGNLNYPDEARRANLSGDLLLDVAIKADGSLHSVKVVRSSGHRVLDEGATRIVQMAAPYAPLPQSLRKDTDVLHIIRTWQFQGDNRLETH